MSRSKEVENAIKVIQRDIKDWKEMLEIEIEFEDGIDEQQVAYLTQQTTSYNTLLSYIEELEKKIERFNNELDLDYVDNNFIPKDKIRDKIKELEEKRDKYTEENKFGSFMETEDKIQGLKEILGE